MYNASCQKCNQECSTCEETPAKCKNCSFGFFKYQDNCISQCPNRTVYSQTENTCVNKTCPTGYYLSEVDDACLSSKFSCKVDEIFNDYFNKCIKVADNGFWYFPILIFLFVTTLIWLVMIFLKCKNDTNILQVLICWWGFFEPMIYAV